MIEQFTYCHRDFLRYENWFPYKFPMKPSDFCIHPLNVVASFSGDCFQSVETPSVSAGTEKYTEYVNKPNQLQITQWNLFSKNKKISILDLKKIIFTIRKINRITLVLRHTVSVNLSVKFRTV